MSVVEDAPERIAAMAVLTDAALGGRVIGVPAFDALRIVAARDAAAGAASRTI